MMELLFLSLLFVVSYADDSCGWATQYYEWGQDSCELMKVKFQRSSVADDQYLVNSFADGTVAESDAVYTPGFWVGRGSTFHGKDGNPDGRRFSTDGTIPSLESTFPGDSASVAGHSYMAAISGVDFDNNANFRYGEPMAFCNGVRFTTDFGIKMKDHLLKPSSVDGDYKISLDVSLGTNNPNIGVIITHNGVVVPRINAGQKTHPSWADNLIVPFNYFVELRVNPSMGSQQLSIYFFKLGPMAAENIDLFVSPFWVNAVDGEAIFNQHSKYAWYFHTGTAYSIGERYGWTTPDNIGDLINDGNLTGFPDKDIDRKLVRANRFGGTIRSWDSFFNEGTDIQVLWCKERTGVMGPWFLPSTTGYIRVEEQGTPTFSGTRGNLKIKVRPVADLSSGKLKWAGSCNVWKGGEKVWATMNGDYSRVLTIGKLGRLVMDPCGHPDYLGFFASPRSFSIANFKCVSMDGSCASVVPRVGNVGYCYGTISYPSAVDICESDGGHVPQLEEVSLCCEVNDRCSNGKDLIWVNALGKFVNFDTTQTSADFWTRVIDDSTNDVVDVSPSGAFVTFHDSDGVEFTEEFIVPNMEVEVEVNIHAPERDCDEFIMYFDYTAINGHVSSHYSWHVSKSFGVYVTLYDLNNVDPWSEFGELAPVAHGFAGYQNINFYSPAGFSSPDFGINTLTNGGVPAIHGSYGATFVTSIYHIVDECCQVSVTCADDSICSISGLQNGNAEACFDRTNHKFKIEIEFRKLRRSAPTFIGLYWSCPSHLAVDVGDDSLAATRSSRVNVLQLNANTFSGIIPNNYDQDGIWRIIPAGCLDARLGAGGSGGSGLVINREDTISFAGSEAFRVALLTRPENSVTVRLSGPFSFNKCSLLFTVDNWHTSQIVFASVSEDTKFDNDEVIMTCSSEDSSYDGVTERVVPDLTVLYTASCQMDFLKRPLNSWTPDEMSRASEMAASNYVGDFVVFGPTTHSISLYPNGVMLHVHARAESCGSHSCVTSVGIQHGRDIFAVYKAAGSDSFSFNVLSDSSSSASVHEEFGCWKLALPDNNVIHICPNTNSYLDINLDLNVGRFAQTSDPVLFEGSCFGNLVVPQSSVLKYPVEMVPHGKRSLLVCEGGVALTNGLDNVITVVQPPMSAISQVVSNPYNLEHQGPLNCAIGGAMSNVLPRAFGDESGDKENVRLWCEGFNDALFTGANDAVKVSFSIISYFHSVAHYKTNPYFFADSMIANNPLFCPLGEVSSGGCRSCSETSSSTVPCLASLPQHRDGPTPCTSKHTVLLDESSGKIIKCYMGICEYSSNGFSWEGLPTDPSTTPYCLSAISNGPVLWGFTVTGEEIKSTDFGQSWTPGSYDLTEKVSFTYAHSDSFDNVSPTTNRHSSLSVPKYHWFSGIGSDRWWITPDDLCVYSNRLAVTKSLIYCVRWWCDCLDFDTWSSSFGVSTLA